MADKNQANPSKFNDQSIVDLFDTALMIKNAAEKGAVETVLMTSVNNTERVVYATVHVAKVLHTLKKKVLILNLNHAATKDVKSYFKVADPGVELTTALREEEYLSSAIVKTQMEGVDYTTLDEMDDRKFINLMLTKDLKEKLTPLKNYYDVILCIGPEYGSFQNYANILDMVDSVITVVDARRNNKDKLVRLVNSYRAFDIRSFGVLRSK